MRKNKSLLSLLKENTVVLKSVIISFSVGVAFAYSLSAYFLSWTYSSEAVETFSALGIFVTPLVAIWIFSRWRQQRHTEQLMNQIIETQGRLVETQITISEFTTLAVEIEKLRHKGMRSDKESDLEMHKIKRDLYDCTTRLRHSVMNLSASYELSNPKAMSGKVIIDIRDISVKNVIKQLEPELNKIKAGTDVERGNVLKKVTKGFNKQIEQLKSELAYYYRNG